MKSHYTNNLFSEHFSLLIVTSVPESKWYPQNTAPEPGARVLVPQAHKGKERHRLVETESNNTELAVLRCNDFWLRMYLALREGAHEINALTSLHPFHLLLQFPAGQTQQNPEAMGHLLM